MSPREMKKFLTFFICTFIIAHGTGMAVTIKKASSVSTKQTSVTDAGAGFIPTVMNIISGVQQLNQKQKTLTAECLPSSREIQFVNELVKEWAKTGAATATEVETKLKMKRCQQPSGGYASSVQLAAGTDEDELLCYDWFGDSGDRNTVWEGFPKATTASYCTDGSLSCSEKEKKQVSNIYDVFNLVDFAEADYANQQELNMAANLLNKVEKCSYAKLNAQKKAMWGEFLVNTISTAGQKTSTGSIMQVVGSTANAGPMGALQSLGGFATQFMNK